MSNYFQNNRNMELSTIYYFEQVFQDNWSGINVVKGFSQVTSASLPVVAIGLIEQTTSRFEIGNNKLKNIYVFSFDIFAKSDGQRIDLAGFILDKLKDNWTYYYFSHPSGDNSSLEKTEKGKIFVTDFVTNTKVEFVENMEGYDRFRHSIVVNTMNSLYE